MKYIFIIFLLLCNTAHANTALHNVLPSEVAEIERKIPQPEILKADFKQSKKIEGLQKELLSSGRLIYSRTHGVYFEFKQPFAVTYIFTKKGLMQIEDGKKELISSGSQPFLKEFSQIFTSIFSGKYDELSKHFVVSYGEQGKQWVLSLKPINSSINNIITEITATGDKYPSVLTISEKNGNVTKIKLSGNNSSGLTEDEADYFNF